MSRRRQRRRRMQMLDPDFGKMVRMLITFILALIICAIIGALAEGCTRKVYVPVESVRHDTIKSVTASVDTILSHDSVFVKESGDTVYYYKWKTEYKVKLKTDTAYVAKVDSIQVPYKVEVEKSYIPKSMWYVVLGLGITTLVLGAILYIKIKP